MNNYQINAIDYLRRHLEHKPDELVQITKFDVQPTDYGKIWVAVDFGCPNAPNSMLAILAEMDNWLVCIGKRGKIEAWVYPDSVKDFAGKTWCRIHIIKHVYEDSK